MPKYIFHGIQKRNMKPIEKVHNSMVKEVQKPQQEQDIYSMESKCQMNFWIQCSHFWAVYSCQMGGYTSLEPLDFQRFLILPLVDLTDCIRQAKQQPWRPKISSSLSIFLENLKPQFQIPLSRILSTKKGIFPLPPWFRANMGPLWTEHIVFGD